MSIGDIIVRQGLLSYLTDNLKYLSDHNIFLIVKLFCFKFYYHSLYSMIPKQTTLGKQVIDSRIVLFIIITNVYTFAYGSSEVKGKTLSQETCCKFEKQTNVHASECEEVDGKVAKKQLSTCPDSAKSCSSANKEPSAAVKASEKTSSVVDGKDKKSEENSKKDRAKEAVEAPINVLLPYHPLNETNPIYENRNEISSSSLFPETTTSNSDLEGLDGDSSNGALLGSLIKSSLPIVGVAAVGALAAAAFLEKGESKTSKFTGTVTCVNPENVEGPLINTNVTITGKLKTATFAEVSKSGFPKLQMGEQYFEISRVQSWKGLDACRSEAGFEEALVEVDINQKNVMSSPDRRVLSAVTKLEEENHTLYRRLNKRSTFYLGPQPSLPVEKFMEYQDEEIRDSYLGSPKTQTAIKRLFRERFLVKESFESEYRSYGKESPSNEFLSLKTKPRFRMLKTAVFYLPLTGDEANAFRLENFAMQYFLLSLAKDYRVFVQKVDNISDFDLIQSDIGKAKVDLVIFGAHSSKSGMRFTSKENIKSQAINLMNPMSYAAPDEAGFFSLGYPMPVVGDFNIKLKANILALGKALSDLDQKYFHIETKIVLLGCDTGKITEERFYHQGDSYKNIADYFARITSKEVIAPNRSIDMTAIRAVTRDYETSIEFYNELLLDPSLRRYVEKVKHRNQKYFEQLTTERFYYPSH